MRIAPRFSFIVLALALAACSEPTGNNGSSTKPPGWTPVDPPMGQLIDCATAGGTGAIVKINLPPASTSLQNGAWYHSTGEVIRDNPNIAGVQYFCDDKQQRMKFWSPTGISCLYVQGGGFYPPYSGGIVENPHVVAVQAVGCVNTVQKVIAAAHFPPYPGTNISAKRDTTNVLITP